MSRHPFSLAHGPGNNKRLVPERFVAFTARARRSEQEERFQLETCAAVSHNTLRCGPQSN
jgi:hypothetical protein